MIVKIEMPSDKLIRFTTILGVKYVLRPKDILMVKRNNNFANIKTGRNNFITISNFNRFRDFILHLKKLNPDMIIKGY
jgi:hypothetical protein